MTDSEKGRERPAGSAGEGDAAAALDTVRELECAVRALAADLPFEAEPSHHARLMEELAPKVRGDE